MAATRSAAKRSTSTPSRKTAARKTAAKKTTAKRPAAAQAASAKAAAVAKAKAVAPGVAVRMGSTPSTKFRGNPDIFGRLVEDHDRHRALLAMVTQT